MDAEIQVSFKLTALDLMPLFRHFRIHTVLYCLLILNEDYVWQGLYLILIEGACHTTIGTLRWRIATFSKFVDQEKHKIVAVGSSHCLREKEDVLLLVHLFAHDFDAVAVFQSEKARAIQIEAIVSPLLSAFCNRLKIEVGPKYDFAPESIAVQDVGDVSRCKQK